MYDHDQSGLNTYNVLKNDWREIMQKDGYNTRTYLAYLEIDKFKNYNTPPNIYASDNYLKKMGI